MKYIVTKQPIEQFNCKGESLGMSDKLAVFYFPRIGRLRYYRQSMAQPQKGLKLLSFKTEKGAQKVCDTINEISRGGWNIELASLD